MDDTLSDPELNIDIVLAIASNRNIVLLYPHRDCAVYEVV